MCSSAARPPVKCPHGKFSAQGAASCSDSTTADFELKNGSVTDNNVEHKCAAGLECINGGIGVDGVKKCAGGKYSTTRGSTCGLNCPVGYFCPPGYPGKLLCPPGHFCEALAEYPTPIPETSYGRKWGAISATDGAV